MPTYTIKAPNGKDYSIEGPAGATKEQVIAAVLRKAPEAGQAPATPERSIGNRIGMGARAVIGGIADTAQAAVDYNPFTAPQEVGRRVGAAITGNKSAPAPLADKFTSAAEWAADKLGLTKPETSGERIGSAAIRGATGALMPGGVGSKLVNSAAGGTAGAVSEVANQAGLPWYAALPASIAAGALVGAPSIVKNGLGAARARTKLDPTKGAEYAARTLQKNTDNMPEAVAALEGRTLPTGGFRPAKGADGGLGPTLPEITGDRGNAALLRDRPSNQIQSRMDNNAARRMEAVQQNMGDGDTAALPALANKTGEANQYALERAHGKLGSSNPVDRDVSGATSRDTFESEYASARARTKAAYEAPILKAEQPVIVGRSLLDKVRNTLQDFYGEAGGTASPKTREVLGDLMDNLDGPNGTGPFNTNSSVVTNIDSRLADIVGTAKARGARQEAAFAQRLRDDLANHVADQLPKEYTAALKVARAARFEQGQKFEYGRLGKAMKNDKFGRPLTSDTELGSRVVQPGAAGGTMAKELIAAVGPKASETTVRQEIARRVAEGKLSTQSQVTGLEEVLKQFPGLKADVEAVRSQVALNEQFAKSHLGQMGDLSKSPSARIADLLRAKDDGVAFKELTQQVVDSGDEKALAGLRKSIADYAVESSDGTRVAASGEKLPSNSKALDAVTRILDRGGPALTDEQRTVFEQLKREYGRTEFAKTGGVAPEAEGQHNIPAVSGMWARTLKFVNEHLGNKLAVDGLVQKALLDPDFAAELLKRPTPDRLAKLKRTARSASRAAAVGSIVGPVPQESN